MQFTRSSVNWKNLKRVRNLTIFWAVLTVILSAGYVFYPPFKGEIYSQWAAAAILNSLCLSIMFGALYLGLKVLLRNTAILAPKQEITE